MLTQTSIVSKTAAIILVRLLTPPARFTEGALRRNLEPFFQGRDPGAWETHFEQTLANLEREGLIAQNPLALTEAGRAQALEFLGLESLPPELDWKQLKSKYLVAAALGMGKNDDAGRTRVGQAAGLRLAILQARYQLPPVATMPEALDALVRKALDMEPTEEITLRAVKAKVLGRFLKVLGNPDLKEFAAQAPVDAVKAAGNSTDDLQAAVLRNWLAEDGPVASTQAPTIASAAPVGESASPYTAMDPRLIHPTHAAPAIAESAHIPHHIAAPPALFDMEIRETAQDRIEGD